MEERHKIRERIVVTADLTYFNMQVHINDHFLKIKPTFSLSDIFPQWKEIHDEMRHYHNWKDVHHELKKYWYQPPCLKNTRGGYHYRRALCNFTLYNNVHMD